MKTDLRIQRNVMDELKWEPSLQSTDIGVTVKQGVVTLTGTVDSYSKKSAAESAASRIFGVKAVADEIEVKLSSISIKNDSEIAVAIVNALKWQSAMQENRIKVKVEKGWVTLEGEVEWAFQKESARNVILNLPGVWAISNNIKIAPVVKSNNIREQIKSAFERSATVDSEAVRVSTEGGHVILSGKVHSWAEKKDAEKVAWRAPGVSVVENNIEITSEALAF